MLRSPLLRVRALMLLLPLLLLLAACGGAQQVAPPTNTPVPSATPRSSPLPPLDTPVPLGDAANPLVILLVPQAAGGVADVPAAVMPTELPAEPPTEVSTVAAAEAGTGTVEPTLDVTATPDLASLPPEVALETLLLARSGLAVDVVLVNSYGEISARLCGAAPVVGWVDGLSALVAQARGCAAPALLVERAGTLGASYDLLIASRVASNGARAVRNEALCRLSDEDFASWFVPSLMLYRAGIDPLGDEYTLVDVADYDAIVAGLYDRTCVIGGVPQGYLSRVSAPQDLAEQVEVLETSPVFPYNIMMHTSGVPLYIQQRLEEGFVGLANAPETAGILRALLDQGSLRRLSEPDAGAVWSAFQAFMNATDLDFAALGE